MPALHVMDDASVAQRSGALFFFNHSLRHENYLFCRIPQFVDNSIFVQINFIVLNYVAFSSRLCVESHPLPARAESHCDPKNHSHHIFSDLSLFRVFIVSFCGRRQNPARLPGFPLSMASPREGSTIKAIIFDSLHFIDSISSAVFPTPLYFQPNALRQSFSSSRMKARVKM